MVGSVTVSFLSYRNQKLNKIYNFMFMFKIPKKLHKLPDKPYLTKMIHILIRNLNKKNIFFFNFASAFGCDHATTRN